MNPLAPLTPYWTELVIKPLTAGIELFAHYLGSYALAIIAFTIAVKLVILPLTIKATMSQRAMQALGPQLNEIKKQYANDRTKQSQETMRLYQENKVNPAGGCLPLVIQFPILIGLYQSLYAISKSNELSAGFLWVKSLALPDTWMAHGVGIDHNGLFLLPLLAGLGQLIQQRMMMTNTTDPQQKMMNQIMQFMPLMIVYFGFQFPAGLALYWCTSTLFAIVQQYFITGWGQLLPGTVLSGPRKPFFGAKSSPPALTTPTAPPPQPLPPVKPATNGKATPPKQTTAARPSSKRPGHAPGPRVTASRDSAPPRRQGGKR